ncbi:hypothetical protein C8F01DRAFT_1136088 [Mycena amicta]|nr:hypothetical protein C8F01DRAFT_1136088 [Mycena amicta]
MAKLFAAQEKLYNRGARNFLFINIPPIDRAVSTTACYGGVYNDEEASESFEGPPSKRSSLRRR